MKTKTDSSPSPQQLELPLPASSPVDGGRLLTRRELAARWSCCPRTIERMEAAGQLKAVRFNKRNIRYTMSSILAAEGATKAVDSTKEAA